MTRRIYGVVHTINSSNVAGRRKRWVRFVLQRLRSCKHRIKVIKYLSRVYNKSSSVVRGVQTIYANYDSYWMLLVPTCAASGVVARAPCRAPWTFLVETTTTVLT